MHTKQIITAGMPLGEARKAIIMLHGRGANAEDILSVANYLNTDNFALIAPQATNNTWYPYSFVAPAAQNEPWLTSALDIIKQVTTDINTQGIANENNFNQTPVFIGSSNPDFHIPVARVYASANILKNMGANVTEKLYDNMGHTINKDELQHADAILNRVSPEKIPFLP